MNFHHSFRTNQQATLQTKILGVGTFLPNEVVQSDDLMNEIKSSEQYGIPINWISRFMGIKERRMSALNAKPSDLAIPAAEKAIVDSGVNPDEIDLVIFAGIERDQPEPATAHIIQNKLGLKAFYAFDMANACIGFVDAIQVASNFLATNSVKYALVVTGEISTHVSRSIVDELKHGVSREKAIDCIGSLTVGDAGGAVVLGLTDGIEGDGFKYFDNSIDSSHVDKCIYRRTKDGFDGHMKMSEILEVGINMHRHKIQNTLDNLNWQNFDWVISHQTGYRNFKAFMDFNCVENENMIKTYPLYGNATTATFALQWEKLKSSDSIKAGDRIGGLFAGSGMTICQFGVVY